jgi:hypothetical protein
MAGIFIQPSPESDLVLGTGRIAAVHSREPEGGRIDRFLVV